MSKTFRSLIASLGLPAALALGAGAAGATCMLPSTFTAGRPQGVALHVPAGWATPAPAVLADLGLAAHTIAGFWKFTFTDTAGNVADFGYIGMHEGGTETMNSFGRPPVTGDVCMGVWERQGPHRYKVSHYAPIFDVDNTTFLGTLNIAEDLTLAGDGRTFSGTTLATGYDTAGNVLFQAEGLATASRVTAGTPAP